MRLLMAVVCAGLIMINSAWAGSAEIQRLIASGTGASLLKAGLMYENGDSVSKNIVEAARLYLLAANKGNFHAHYALWDTWEDFSRKGAPEPPFNDPYQFAKSQQLALAGYKKLLIKYPRDAEIHYRLARLYSSGEFHGKEYELEIKHLKIAAKLGNKEAKALLKLSKQLNQHIN